MTQATIIVTLTQTGTYNVRTPYEARALRQWRSIGHWDRTSKSWCVKARHRTQIDSILRQWFAGSVGVGPFGAFTVMARGAKMPAR